MSTWATKILDYHLNLDYQIALPDGVDFIIPYDDKETRRCMDLFYNQYYRDNHQRIILFGINPGRFGAGVTGIPFTDPVHLETHCAIENSFDKRAELSSTFIHNCIEACGGLNDFYQKYYISSVFPLGFIKDKKNYNYYDSRELIEAVNDQIVTHIEEQIAFGADTSVAYSIGKGKNQEYLTKLNAKHHFFDDIIALPHPRWVMQYRLKRKAEFIDEYVKLLAANG